MEQIELKNGVHAIKGDCMVPEINKRGLCFDLMVEHDIIPRLKKGDVVIDAGAAIGDHTVKYCEAVGDSGYVFAFEPCWDSFQCLVKNCPNAIPFNKALWDSYDKLWLHVAEGNIGASFLNKIPYSVSGEPVQGPIHTIRLDDLCLTKLDYIKLDVEGTELFVLRGGVETIKNFRPWMVIEMNSGALANNGVSHMDIYKFLDDLNYDHDSLRNTPGKYCTDCDIIAIPR